MLTPTEAADLEEFFTRGEMEKSPMGTMLEMAELFSFHEPHNGVVEVQPTHELRQSDKSGPDFELLSLLGSVSRRLREVNESDPESFRVLVAYYSDQGAAWEQAKANPHGRMASVFHLTPSAKAAIQRSKMRSGVVVDIDDARRLKAIASTTEFSMGGRELMARIRIEAVALLDRAGAAWKATGSEKSRGRKPGR